MHRRHRIRNMAVAVGAGAAVATGTLGTGVAQASHLTIKPLHAAAAGHRVVSHKITWTWVRRADAHTGLR